MSHLLSKRDIAFLTHLIKNNNKKTLSCLIIYVIFIILLYVWLFYENLQLKYKVVEYNILESNKLNPLL